MSNRIIVFEREPYWAPELRRQFEGTDVTVRQCIDLSSLAEVAPDASDVIVASLEGNERDCAELLRQVTVAFKIIISPSAASDLEAPFREAGASSFVVEHLSGEELARRIRLVWSSAA